MAAPTVSEPRRETVEDERPTLYLLVVGPAFTSTQVLPASGLLLVGRDEGADVRIVDPLASRRHAQLHVGAAVEVEDLDSANGTHLRDRKLTPGQRTPMAIGETLTIGSTMLVVQRREPATRPRRLWPHGYFEARLIEECGRAEQVRGTFALARISIVATGLPRQRVEEIVGAHPVRHQSSLDATDRLEGLDGGGLDRGNDGRVAGITHAVDPAGADLQGQVALGQRGPLAERWRWGRAARRTRARARGGYRIDGARRIVWRSGGQSLLLVTRGDGEQATRPPPSARRPDVRPHDHHTLTFSSSCDGW